MKKSVGILIGIIVSVILVINVFFKDPSFENLSDRAGFEIKSDQPELAEKTILQIIENDKYNVDNHYTYIKTHFDIPQKKKISKRNYVYRNDTDIRAYYDSLSRSADTLLSDIGFYGNGLIAVNFGYYPEAIHEFLNVKKKNLKYLNNSLGNAYRHLDSLSLAEKYFRGEIRNKGNVSGAYSNLIELLYETGKLGELNQLLRDEKIRPYFPFKIERAVYFHHSQFMNYTTTLFKGLFYGVNMWGTLAAFLIMLSWVIYLRKLDIYEAERWKYVIACTALGMVFSLLTFPLSDFDNVVLGLKLNGKAINDFFYCVIGIGAIEELVKIIPLLLMIKFTKVVDEPFDYILYASLSALGFSFVENLIYFHESNLHIIHGRALTAVVSHMFDSSIIAYGLLLNKYKMHWNPYLNFGLFYLLASFAHGFYDFWLISESVSGFSMVTILFLFISIFIWNSLKNNALNHSNFFDKEKSIDNQKLQAYLLYALVGILLVEYFIFAVKYGPGVANKGLYSSVFSGTYLILFLSTNLSKFTLNKQVWGKIKYWGFDEKDNFEEIVNSEIVINRFTNNRYTLAFLPNHGKVIKRLTVSKEPDWYLVKLNHPKQLPSFYGDFVLVRTKNKWESLVKYQSKIIAFYIIPEYIAFDNAKLERSDLVFCGWATIE